MKKNIFYFVLLMTALALQAQSGGREGDDGKDGTSIIPVVYGSGLFLGEQTIRGAGGGVIVLSGDFEQREAELRNTMQTVALYTRHDLMEEAPDDCPEGYNNLDFFLQRKLRRHQFFTLLKSSSDEPVYGGIETFDFVGGYGFELVSGGRHSLWLGASLGVSDWGPMLPGGGETPVLPVPFLHYDYFSPWMNFSFDFTTSPMMDFIIAPQGRVRVIGSAIVCDLGEAGDGGIKYDLSLEYRFFSREHRLGDFAGARIGYLAEDYEYDLSGRSGESLQIAWKSVYATLDLSLLELTAGYAFDGRQYYDDAEDDLGSGWYVKLQLAWLF